MLQRARGRLPPNPSSRDGDCTWSVDITGTFNGIIDFGDGDLVSGASFGGSDGFLAKLLP